MSTGKAQRVWDTLPCGCQLLTDGAPVDINGVDMTHMVANISGAVRCPVHQAEWDEAMQKFVAEMDARAMAKIYQDIYKPKGQPAEARQPKRWVVRSGDES